MQGCGRRQRENSLDGDHAGMYLRSTGLHGVFIGAHAVSEGVLTRHQLQNGPYVRVLHGVYADPSLARDHRLRCRAAALLMPASAVLGGRSAAALMGAPSPGYGDPVTVVVPPGTKWRGPGGVRVHTADVPAADVVLDEEGTRHTDPVRTAWDVGTLEPIGTAVGVLDAMVRMRLLDVGTLQQLLERPLGAWRSRRARRASGWSTEGASRHLSPGSGSRARSPVCRHPSRSSRWWRTARGWLASTWPGPISG
jgi:hypothetical protein